MKDIFISYKRVDEAKALDVVKVLEKQFGIDSYWIDTTGIESGEYFRDTIMNSIRNSSVVLFLMSKTSVISRSSAPTWVQKEVLYAIKKGKKVIPISIDGTTLEDCDWLLFECGELDFIDWNNRKQRSKLVENLINWGIVPVNPDGTYDGLPNNVPQEIRSAIEDTQHSEVNFGQTLNVTVDQMVKNRIKPYVHHYSWCIWLGIAAVLCAVTAIGCIYWQNKKVSDAIAELEALKQEITFQGNSISWPEDIDKVQLLTIKEIFDNMQLIEGGEFIQGVEPLSDGIYHENVEVEFETPAHKENIGAFYISKFEVTKGQWNAIMKEHRGGDKNLPIDSVSYNQAKKFCQTLFETTGVDFRLPTEPEWEYAAKGGSQPEGFMFAGSDNPDDVAWYAKNSGGKSHSDLRATATFNDIFNMSGNVSEWCDTEFKPYDCTVPVSDEKVMVIRGGNYDSEEYEITTTHREPARPDIAIPTLGFRLAIKK